jgi:hypothetical protein
LEESGYGEEKFVEMVQAVLHVSVAPPLLMVVLLSIYFRPNPFRPEQAAEQSAATKSQGIRHFDWPHGLFRSLYHLFRCGQSGVAYQSLSA